MDFIEESLDVNDQIDVDKDNVIHAFYRDHNTLHKMNENFRLLEYKRKKYIEKSKSNSKSPPKRRLSAERSTQKNFLSSIYGGPDKSGKQEQ